MSSSAMQNSHRVYLGPGPITNTVKRTQSFDSGTDAFTGPLYTMDGNDASGSAMTRSSFPEYDIGRAPDRDSRPPHQRLPMYQQPPRGERPFRDSFLEKPQAPESINFAQNYRPPIGHDYAPNSIVPVSQRFVDTKREEPVAPGLFAPSSLSQAEADDKEEKAIRRRSSKACDGCRKSKCKCERTAPTAPCSNCLLLGIECTFLGPSRKRGPPKGYIDAIEARLHQTEALLGIMIAASKGGKKISPLSSGSESGANRKTNKMTSGKRVSRNNFVGDDDGVNVPTHTTSWNPDAQAWETGSASESDGEESSTDDRARQLLTDIAQDPLAQEIINRVDNSAYGYTGRQLGLGNDAKAPGSRLQSQLLTDEDDERQHSHPSNEWQDSVVAMLRTMNRARKAKLRNTGNSDTAPVEKPEPSRFPLQIRLVPGQASQSAKFPMERLQLTEPYAKSRGVTLKQQLDRRQRRRLADDLDAHKFSRPSSGGSGNSRDPSPSRAYRDRIINDSESNSSEDEDNLIGAVGQLSLNEDEQVRYHGKASGLHLLVGTGTERNDTREEGGIWRFPKARVWPPLPSTSLQISNEEDAHVSQLPDPELQEHLLQLYFTYVHPALPVVHKQVFFDAYRNHGRPENTSPTDPQSASANSTFGRRRRRVPTLLLLAMFAITARYSPRSPPEPQPPHMWPAGDDYLDRAKVILDKTYASSRPSTCQALLLMGYREIGIGAMAQAWTYIGMAIRMAQDLGMHRSADGWARAGGNLFNPGELAERKRIWYACVIMDKYVSTYIGRPLSIFERDCDTPLPSETDSEELETWKPHNSSLDGKTETIPEGSSHVISCFNASAKLAGIIGTIVQSIYAVQPVSKRHTESTQLERVLSKWWIDLPSHLRYDSAASKSVPPPHILTLHMQYWCSVLLLHRPFIRNNKHPNSPESGDDGASRTAEKRYELCAGAAIHITSIVSTYMEHYSLKRCPVFFCYYVFSAGVMHVVSLSTFPNDPQARVGLAKCMEALAKMQVIWPSAGRAHELLVGSNITPEGPYLSSGSQPDRHKRAASTSLDDSFIERRTIQSNPYQSSYGALPPEEYANMYPNNRDALTYGPSGWPSNSMPSFNALSTSALPPMYSSGLLDQNRNLNTVMEIENYHNTNSPAWNDYSALAQPPYSGLPSPSDQELSLQHPNHQQNHPSGVFHYSYLS